MRALLDVNVLIALLDADHSSHVRATQWFGTHARAGWEEAKRMIADPSYKMVMLDELNIVLRYDYLPLAEVLEVLKNRPADKHIVVTGRNAKEELIEIADLVTEMELIKHPFRSGVKAQAGIEF